MTKEIVKKNSSEILFEESIIKGNKILCENEFFQDFISLMHNIEFNNFYKKYFQNWSDIETMIFYMKLYTTIDYEYSNRFNNKISDEAMTYTIKQIMENRDTRRFAFDLFKDFKDISHKNTGSFRTLLNFDDKESKKKKKKMKKIKQLAEEILQVEN